MALLKRIFVALDASPKDIPLLKHANKFAHGSGAEKIYFVHVQKSLNLPIEVTDEFPEMQQPLDESIRQKMTDLIHENLPNVEKLNHELIIEEGDPAETIIKLVKRKDASLVIMGQDSQGNGTGSVARKIASFAPCSILFAPELLNVDGSSPKALVPVKFSETCNETLKQLDEISKSLVGLKSMVINCYDIPSGYSATGKSYEEMVQILGDVSLKKLNHFVKNAGLTQEVETKAVLIEENESAADAILKTAREEKSNLVVMGSKSRTFMASMVLGSTAEKLLLSDLTIPILIYKNKESATLDIFNLFDRI